MPHPPVVVAEVGRGRERDASVTVDGMKRLAGLLTDRRPECLLVLSPHQPSARSSLFVNSAPHLEGSFMPFGADVSFKLNTSAKLHPLVEYLAKSGIPVREANAPDLENDWGSLVPLYFLRKEWSKHDLELPDVILASPIGLGPEKSILLGESLASFDDNISWGLLASGDLSHRLTPDAPAGYSTAGKKFDKTVVAALSSVDPLVLLNITPQERADAGECGLCSVLTMLGFCRALHKTIEVISYEGPFGVGYCNALA